jgi:hypothetical protein
MLLVHDLLPPDLHDIPDDLYMIFGKTYRSLKEFPDRRFNQSECSGAEFSTVQSNIFTPGNSHDEWFFLIGDGRQATSENNLDWG